MKKTLVLVIVVGALWISSAEVCAVNYYVDATGGNDTNDGLSDATAWQTIGKVNNYSFLTGDDVFFKCGGTWTGTYLFVDWSGSDNDRVVIGAYYIDGGNEVHGISGNKPIIDGNDTAPTDNYDGLITIENREYITVENIHIKRSAGYGVWNYRSDNTLVDNIYIKRTYMQGVYFYDSNNCTLQHSDVSETCRYGNGSVVAFRNSNNILIQYNTIHETSNEQIIMNSGREGINFLYSDNSAAIGNVIYDCKGLGIYLDHAQYATVKNNLIYYTDNTDYWRSNTKPSRGIVFTDEEAQGPDHLARDITVVGNLIASCGEGITLWSGPLNTNDPALINVVIANNTIVEPRSTDGSHRSLVIDSSARHSNSIIKNNVFWQSTGQIAYAPADPDLAFSNNLWSQPQVDVDNDAKGPGDVYGQVPCLTKTTGWNSLAAGNLDGSEFALQSCSPAIDAGTNLGSPYNQGLSPSSTWPNNVSTLDQNGYGDWEIGAYVFTGADINSDGKVDLNDVAVLSVWWDDENACSAPGWCGRADFDMSGTVDMSDLAYLAENWLRQ
ncbi:MAG: right-handed parallel beta-helix repeat-containing protein [Sedimentisphaerales bacterium]|nr:right-handed parallel beta-helix repeat-containing protein [Sedimentisphaerales bacterium]